MFLTMYLLVYSAGQCLLLKAIAVGNLMVVCFNELQEGIHKRNLFFANRGEPMHRLWKILQVQNLREKKQRMERVVSLELSHIVSSTTRHHLVSVTAKTIPVME